jgi:hypothetical protein
MKRFSESKSTLPLFVDGVPLVLADHADPECERRRVFRRPVQAILSCWTYRRPGFASGQRFKGAVETFLIEQRVAVPVLYRQATCPRHIPYDTNPLPTTGPHRHCRQYSLASDTTFTQRLWTARRGATTCDSAIRELEVGANY